MKYDYRKRFSSSRDTSCWSLRLAWAKHKAYWQGCFGENVCYWTDMRIKELKNVHK